MIASHPSATAFHTSAWARVLTETYGHKPYYLQLGDAGETSVSLPLLEVNSPLTGRRGVSLPFTDVCPPLVSGSFAHDSLGEELSALAEERSWKHFELRGADWLRGVAPAAASFYGHKLALTTSINDLEKQLASNVRRNVRKAERSGVTAEVTDGRDAVLKFYKLLVRTRRRHGVPPQSRKFFLKIHEHLIAPGHAFVVLAHRKQRPLAGAIYFRFQGNALYKFGASDERLQEFRASTLVMWTAIRHLAETGATQLHFGRTDLDAAGLRRFKLAWGAEEEMIEYFRFQRDTAGWSTAKRDLVGQTRRVFRNLPLAVNRLIGTMVYPHLD
ncbi:MAG: lipid II:glycine glycyltransferase FemX [Chthoniobacterales bacterium]